MSIFEIEEQLPNGLHDSVLNSYCVDYENKQAIINLDIWAGDLDSDSYDERERYQKGILRFDGLVYFVVEPPTDNCHIFEPLSFSAGDPDIDKIRKSVDLPCSPEGAFKVYFFLYKLEAFIHICANDVSFEYAT